MDVVYVFYYCPCIYESGYMAVSLHRTMKGAYLAMKEHRLNVFNEWRSKENQYRKSHLDTVHQDWSIGKKDILN